MRRRRKKRKKAFFVQVAEAIVSMGIIDLDRDGNGYPTVHWMIAEYLLRELKEHRRNELLYGGGYPARVSRIFHTAKKYALHHLHTPIYSVNGGRTLRCITTDAAYRDAKEQQYNRIEAGLKVKVESNINELRVTNPEKINQLAKTTSRWLLLGGAAKQVSVKE